MSRPKRRKPGTLAAGQVETVAQFEARGGQVQRLPASWEQAA
ncbi:hypothetical protein [Stenotrophomonas indicatrix]|nr:hypothetical protein [Stenotrophomonas indicatrix]